MVKERRRRSPSYSDDEDGYKKKHHKKNRSRSPDQMHHRHKKHSHRHHNDDIDVQPRIKVERESPESDNEHRRRHHIKPQHHRHQHHRSGESGHRRGDRVRVKQEPPDSDEEMMQHQRAERRQNDRRRQDNRQKREHLSEHERYGRPKNQDASSSDQPAQPKDEPNFELSGKLTEDTNTYKGVVIKYNEPPEARKPKKRWRLYPFKNDEALKPFHMHRQSAFLFGRDRLVADIPVDHPSCSKQHAVYQYRMVPYEKEDGRRAHKIAPYIIDLESANGTFVNNKKIEPRCYVELWEKDVIKFGFSSREYVLLHDKSSTAEVESGEESS